MAEPNAGTAIPYRGPAGAFRDSVWLTADDLPEKDVTLEIVDVMMRKDVTFQAGRVKPAVGTLKFKGMSRELGLNATNNNTMMKLYGRDTGGWIGKRVTLYVDPNVSMAGKIMRGVRIRATVPAAEVK